MLKVPLVGGTYLPGNSGKRVVHGVTFLGGGGGVSRVGDEGGRKAAR